MTPTTGGRHCAACQQVVVDFTGKTDAELLAYFRQARPGQTCGRFYTDQLSRPLRPAAPVNRWRAGLALLLAAWSPAVAAATGIPASAATHYAPRPAASRPTHRAVRYVQGTVRNAESDEYLAGVAVFLKGENRQAVTDANGWFRLPLRARRPRGGRALVLHCAGYASAIRPLPASRRPALLLALRLQPDEAAASGVQVVGNLVSREGRRISYGTSLFTQMGAAPSPAAARPATARPTSRLRLLWRHLTKPFRFSQRSSYE